ncbi:AAA family ATPase [Devosia aurantiaca]|uniref:AAA family ATPase n=1 Tax=Devosia aurantiaca TaxID=2714858 RepID=A0A6M1SPZ1_9HYPH|nr:AAA family ATPase [Devosia aurantiaca]NGP16533.1 AAA family ATPase [Devosia aurantiaca]
MAPFLIEDDDESDDPKLDTEQSPLALAVQNGRALPAVMLKRALSWKFKLFAKEPGICVLIRVRSSDWIGPFVWAARTLGSWPHVIEGDAAARAKDKPVRDALDRLAAGDRVLAIYPMSLPVPRELRIASDIDLEIVKVSASDVSKAIYLATGSRARGVSKAIPADLDLQQALHAIRLGSTPALCIRRLSVTLPAEAGNGPVIDAPPLDALHGYGEAMVWANRLVSDLERWRAGQLDFESIQKNAVLAGLPGTGKSTFVRSLSKSSGLPLVTSSLSQLFGTSAGYLDSIIKAIDALFLEAKSKRNCILFIDELDAFPNRTTLDSNRGSWWTPVVNHMLTILDSSLSDASKGLVIVGATNHPHKLDSALLRPGRLDRILWIDLPDEQALDGIFRQHLGTELAGEDLSAVALAAVGSTGAMAAGAVKAARGRARSEGRAMIIDDLMDEVCPPAKMSDADHWISCVHESGHAVACVLLGVARLKSVAVIAGQDGVGGRTVSQPLANAILDENRNRDRVIQLLAGRAAEEVILGTVSGGAGGGQDSDLHKASKLLASAHLSLGLRGTLMHFADPEDALAVARRSPHLIASIEGDLVQLYDRAKGLIRSETGVVLSLAERLKKKRVVMGPEVEVLVESARRDRSE